MQFCDQHVYQNIHESIQTLETLSMNMNIINAKCSNMSMQNVHIHIRVQKCSYTKVMTNIHDNVTS